MKKPSLPKQQKLEATRLKKLMAFESRARQQGFKWIAGVDEAGCAPLAGPVVAAACILPEKLRLSGIDDSKKLTPEEREELYQKIMENPDILLGVGIVDALIIDQINILQATFEAMIVAIGQLKQKPDYALVDGNRLPKLEMPCEGIVKGDTLSQSIMVAGILAKVTRDRIMIEHHKTWPDYGFAEHKGYPTPKHFEMLKKLGPCPIHRKSFGPVRVLVK
jgi:ribonuclease HII